MSDPVREARVEAMARWVAEMDAAIMDASGGKASAYGLNPVTKEIREDSAAFSRELQGIAEEGEATAVVADIVALAYGIKRP